MTVYIYIYVEREREREVYTYIHTYLPTYIHTYTFFFFFSLLYPSPGEGPGQCPKQVRSRPSRTVLGPGYRPYVGTRRRKGHTYTSLSLSLQERQRQQLLVAHRRSGQLLRTLCNFNCSLLLRALTIRIPTIISFKGRGFVDEGST